MTDSNSQSVTDEHCECGFLSRAVNHPLMPIGYCESTDQFYFEYEVQNAEAKLMIYHCHMCGGIAPDSHAPPFFHEFNSEQCDDIVRRLASCVTLADVIAIFGAPDADEMTRIEFPESQANEPRRDMIRRISYNDISTEMRVMFTQQIDGHISPSFLPKPIVPNG
ncbi:hypothetical protein N9Y42_08795 [Mariniblastus sp.]|nr:hypothetical protein [Mariniblastus sp.]